MGFGNETNSDASDTGKVGISDIADVDVRIIFCLAELCRSSKGENFPSRCSIAAANISMKISSVTTHSGIVQISRVFPVNTVYKIPHAVPKTMPVVPVSYTHLDVYKRQSVYMSVYVIPSNLSSWPGFTYVMFSTSASPASISTSVIYSEP